MLGLLWVATQLSGSLQKIKRVESVVQADPQGRTSEQACRAEIWGKTAQQKYRADLRGRTITIGQNYEAELWGSPLRQNYNCRAEL